MDHRLTALTDGEFDVVVVGGGIYGATLAWAAAVRGCRVALVERADFGHAASANSLKILHGGLRYLQHLDFPRMRESIRARRRLMQLLPHLTSPRAFLVPTYGWGLRSKPLMFAAMTMNDFVSWDRNVGMPSRQRLARGRVLSRRQLYDLLPGLTASADGAAIWHDGFAESSERLTLSFILSAEEAGAVVRNYVAAEALLQEGSQITGVLVRDEESGETAEVRARCVIAAAGPWNAALDPARDAGNRQVVPWTRAYNVVLRRDLFDGYGVGLESMAEYEDSDAVLHRGNRNYFFTPWHKGSILGTIYKPHSTRPEECSLTTEEISGFLEEVNRVYPPGELCLEDVTFAHVGLLPAKPKGKDQALDEPAKDTEVIDYAGQYGINGYIEIKSVKYTTAIEVALRVVNGLSSKLERALPPISTMSLYGGERTVTESDVIDSCSKLGIHIDDETARYHARQYGARFQNVFSLAVDGVDALRKVDPGGGILRATIRYSILKEHARHLTDVVFRRTDLASFAYPGRQAISACAETMASELGWSITRLREEIESVHACYKNVGLEHVLKEPAI